MFQSLMRGLKNIFYWFVRACVRVVCCVLCVACCVLRVVNVCRCRGIGRTSS